MKQNSRLEKQYPTIAAFFKANHKNAGEISFNMDAAICEALDQIDENGQYELGRFDSVTGNPSIFTPLTKPIKEKTSPTNGPT